MRQEQTTNEQADTIREIPSGREQDWALLSIDFRRHGERIEALYRFLEDERETSISDWKRKPEERSVRQADVMRQFIDLLGDRFPAFLDMLLPSYQEPFRLLYQEGMTRRQCAVAMGVRSETISEEQAGIMLTVITFTVSEIRRLQAEQHTLCADKYNDN